MWSAFQSFLAPDPSTSSIPLRRGGAQKDPHMGIEEPDPYIYEQYPEPPRQTPNVYRPANDDAIMHDAKQSLQFQADALRVTPYDRQHRDVQSVSQKVTVDGFLRPPLRPMWDNYSLTRMPSKIVHPSIPVHPESSTRGGQDVRPDRNPGRLLVQPHQQEPRVKPWDQTSQPGKRIDRVAYIDPRQKGNVHNGPREDSVQRTVTEHMPVTQRMGPQRFWLTTEPKLEDSFMINPARDPHYQITGRAAEENIQLGEKTVPGQQLMYRQQRYMARARTGNEDMELTRKGDLQEQHQYRQSRFVNRVCPGDVNDAHLARYTPVLTPDYQVTSVIPGQDQHIGGYVPVYHDRMTVDNQGTDGLDVTGAAMSALSPLQEPLISGIRHHNIYRIRDYQES